MKKTVLSLMMLLLVFTAANAQNSLQARKILDKTASVVGSKNGARANFTISSSKYGNTSGSIAIKGNKFYANTPKAIVWFNGKTQWSYMHSTNEVSISNPNEAKQMSMNPYKFITMYRNGYDMSMTSKGSNYITHLVAQNSKRSVQELYITISKSSYKPSQVKMRQDKVWTTIDISNFANRNISDDSFVFNAKEFPSAEVVDLR